LPDIKGRFTAQERTFSEAYAATGDRGYSARVAGLAQPNTAASKMLAKPAIQAEIARIQTERLFAEVLPLAVEQHLMLIKSDKTPAGAKVQAIKLAYDRTLGGDGAKIGKEPHEMTGEELAQAIASLESIAAARAKPVQEVQEHQSPDIFE
jgi:phage terminase small subunit